MKLFKSLVDPSKFAYELNDDWNYEKRGNAPLSVYLLKYDTFGDGITKHSPGYCPQWEDLFDVCVSMTAAILEEPNYETWRRVHGLYQNYSDASIRFALSVAYKKPPENTLGETRYYNLADMKISSASSRRHDKRWEEISSWIEGGPKSALTILLNHQSHLDWLDRAFLCQRVRQIHAEDSNYWIDEVEMFEPWKRLNGSHRDGVHVHQALEGLRCALESMRLLDAAGRQLDCAKQNGGLNKPEAKLEVA